MMTGKQMKGVVAVVAALVCVPGNLALANAVIYEPFAQANFAGDVAGQPTGTGLNGNWQQNGDRSMIMQAPGLSYGALMVSSNSADNAARRAGIKAGITGGVLDGLLDDGGELWFSVLHNVISSPRNAQWTFGLGAGSLSYGAPPQVSAGIGFILRDGYLLTAAVWNLAPIEGSTNDLSAVMGSTVLIVGKCTWSATDDTVELYLPDLSGNLGPVVSSWTGSLNQSTALTTLSIGSGPSYPGQTQRIDEIRVGATAADVMPGLFAPPTPGTRIIYGM